MAVKSSLFWKAVVQLFWFLKEIGCAKLKISLNFSPSGTDSFAVSYIVICDWIKSVIKNYHIEYISWTLLNMYIKESKLQLFIWISTQWKG